MNVGGSVHIGFVNWKIKFVLHQPAATASEVRETGNTSMLVYQLGYHPGMSEVKCTWQKQLRYDALCCQLRLGVRRTKV
jgi:hypothetical protein